MRANQLLIPAIVLALSSACSEEEPAGEVTPEPAAADQAAEEQAAAAPAVAEPGAAEQEAAEPAPATATVGQPVPDFTLTDQAGTEHTLSDYRGRIVVLEWINPDCPYVQRHYQAETMKTLVERFPDDRVKWLAIDSSHFVEPSDSEQWREEHGLSYPILQDPAGDVGRTYEARTTPHMFVIDPEGVLRYAGAIDDDPRGRSDQPTNHVGNAVQSLLDGEAPPVTQTEPYGCTVKYQS